MLFMNSIGFSVILIAGYWASFSLIEKCQNFHRILDLFRQHFYKTSY